MGRPHKCPYCDATDTVSKGVRKTKTMGNRRIRLCKACKRKFTPRNQKPLMPGQDVPQENDANPEPEADARPQTAEAKPAAEPQPQPAENLGQMLPPPDQEWTS